MTHYVACWVTLICKVIRLQVFPSPCFAHWATPLPLSVYRNPTPCLLEATSPPVCPSDSRPCSRLLQVDSSSTVSQTSCSCSPSSTRQAFGVSFIAAPNTINFATVSIWQTVLSRIMLKTAYHILSPAYDKCIHNTALLSLCG